MWHGRGTDFAVLQSLLKVAQRDVTPNVTVQIQQHCIGTRNGIKKRSHPIMRLNLNRVGVLFKAQLSQHLTAEIGPINIRVGAQMRAVIACRAVKLGQGFDRFDRLNAKRQTVAYVCKLFTQCCGCRRLTVRARQHRLLRMLKRQTTYLRQQRIECRHHNLVTSTRKHQRMRSVVDVF